MATTAHKSTGSSPAGRESGAPQHKSEQSTKDPSRSEPSATGSNGSEASVDKPDTQRRPTAALELPFVSASVTLPRPGAAVRVGPVSMTVPTGYLYYGGLGILTVAGAIEWPIAVTFAAGGLLVERIRTHR